MLRRDERSRIVAGSFPHEQAAFRSTFRVRVRRRNRAVHRKGRGSGVCAEELLELPLLVFGLGEELELELVPPMCRLLSSMVSHRRSSANGSSELLTMSRLVCPLVFQRYKPPPINASRNTAVRGQARRARSYAPAGCRRCRCGDGSGRRCRRSALHWCGGDRGRRCLRCCRPRFLRECSRCCDVNLQDY